MRNRVERLFRHLKKRTVVFIPSQAKREKPHTGNKQPEAIPKPIRAILPDSWGKEMSKVMLIRTP